jgi:DSF synthase
MISNIFGSKPLAGGQRAAYGKPGLQYETEFDPSNGTIWGYFKPKGTACFSLGLLKDIRTHDCALEINAGHVLFEGAMHEANHYVTASRTPRVFNLGGDLALFVLLIKSRDREALAHYAKLCIDNMYPKIVNFRCPSMTTIALVQGDALGGGFECALSSDVIVAEESAVFGLPEILFNLFPGMGAYSFLERRLGQKGAEGVIASGKIYSADEMLSLGVIDAVTDNGEGEAGVAALIRQRSRSRNGLAALAQTRRRVHRIEFSELLDIVQIWVDSALRLNPRDLKLMQRLVSRQNGLVGESTQIH